MKNRRMVLTICLVLASVSLSVPETTSAASLSLTLPAGGPGQSVTAGFGFEDTEGIASFSLVLTFSPDSILSTDTSEFFRNEDFFPSHSIDGEEANFTEEVSPGKIYFVGLCQIPQQVRQTSAKYPLALPCPPDWVKSRSSL